jgi:3-oxoacyl-[acyl-carrier-protein] synthase II
LRRTALRPYDRTCQLVAAAAGQALEDGGWTAEACSAHDTALILGTVLSGVHTISAFDCRSLTGGPEYVSPLDFANTVLNAAAGQAAIWHNLRGPSTTISTGVSSGLHAIAYAADLIRDRRCETVLAGGADEVCVEAFHGFYYAGRLCGSCHAAPGEEWPVPFDARRNGFALGEGAALLMLESADSAAARGAAVQAEVAGFGAAFSLDPSDALSLSDTLAGAITAALADGGISSGDVDFVSTGASGARCEDEAEARALRAVFGRRVETLPITAVKSMLGETLGASGALQTVAALETMTTGRLPPVAGFDHMPEEYLLPGIATRTSAIPAATALITTVGSDGNCAAIVLCAI